MEMDENGIVQYSNNPVIVKGQKLLSELPEKEGYAVINQEGYKIMAYRSSIGYVNAIALPENTYQKEMNMWRLKLVVIILAAFGIFSSSVFYLYRLICKPLNQFQKQMIQVGNGSLQEAEQEYEIKEFDDLMHEVEQMKEQIRNLIDVVVEKEISIQRTEYEKLLYQINPHFLFITLESITWMVEAQKNREAVIMISELAKLLRVSLSRGKTIIPIKDELQHSRSYMNIQLVRYKERFKIDFQIDEELYNYCIVKLVIQPILENAIYYGVGHMDEDDDGRIVVSGEKKDNDIYISIEDNGMGMRKEVLENILTDNNKVPKHGSGVGVINVHSRIKLMFGEGYGLTVYSEPDEGTKVVIHIPAIPYTKENAEKLEMQKYSQRGKAHEKE